MSPRTVVLLGASGLVGGHALAALLRDASWKRVVTLGRREMPAHAPHHEHHVVDFAHLERHRDLFACDALAICLGTTIKTAGSREAFRHVDLELPLDCAELAHDRGASAVALVSAYGADPESRVFYSRVKGEAEEAIRSVGFEHVTILRPSLLDGDREEARLAERVGLAVLRPLSPLMRGPLAPLRPTRAEDVARALAASLRDPSPGVRVWTPTDISS